jgi:nucleotide-binding universal stress UspA family protein
MKIKPSSKPGQVVVELDRQDDQLLEQGMKEDETHAWPVQLKNILVPIDFSELSKKALRYAIPLAEKFGAKITLVHVLEPNLYPQNLLAPVELEEIKTRTIQEGEEMLEKLKQEAVHGHVDSAVIATVGMPYQRIIDLAASTEADLIVLTTHGYTGLKHVFLGSTAERVVRHAPCPVLTIRAHEAAA